MTPWWDADTPPDYALTPEDRQEAAVWITAVLVIAGVTIALWLAG